MTDDIITQAFSRDEFLAAERLIDRQRAEIERLRAAGDALVKALETNMMATAVVLLNQWKEARRD